MLEWLWSLSSAVLLEPLDPSLVTELDDGSLCEALEGATLADRIVLVTELLQRGIQV